MNYNDNVEYIFLWWGASHIGASSNSDTGKCVRTGVFYLISCTSFYEYTLEHTCAIFRHILIGWVCIWG